MIDLSPRAVLVTGGALGLGRGYAQMLASLGARVVVADIDGDAAALTAEAIAVAGHVAHAVTMDVADEQSVAAGFDAARAAVGEIGILVNNAGGVFVPPTATENYTLDQWNRVLAINLTGSWLCARAAIPAMKAAGWGRIVNISSTTFAQGLPTELTPYTVSKGGVVGLTRALASELGPFGITVNAVAPGLVPRKGGQTGVPTASDEKRQAIFDLVTNQQAIPRPGEVDDIRGAVAFLASDAAGFITGQVLNVDGGWAFG